ncbi:MAG TPA: isopentenyl-diphosphate Delta-isomerase, partial [Cyclobacteriaceae bacterium]|nr:isopentenyl-diphosphate Delta-isomerase [Cyclobacteriaceae bacterium]
MEHVILVDERDDAIGTMEKIEAHEKGLLHRAFSILLFNSKGEFLLQKRSKKKYHSGGLWTNTCCSHPLPDEQIEEATRRKLKQEMGIEVKTEFAYKFIYKTNLDKNLIEHEYDHVYT